MGARQHQRLEPVDHGAERQAAGSQITSPAGGTSFGDGSQMTVTGTATDTGGGVVAGVEISTDGGSTWHPATITTPDATTVTWSYTWVVHGSSSTTILSRAVDDSANLEVPSDPISITVNCPCSLWGPNAVPTDGAAATDPNSTNLGVKFTTDTFGTVRGLRFYKATTSTGTRVGSLSLWTSTGQLLAQATFTGETASGWQQVNFSTPVAVSPHTTYVVSYYAPNGHYLQTEGYFYPRRRPPLTGEAPSMPRPCMPFATRRPPSTGSTRTPPARPSRHRRSTPPRITGSIRSSRRRRRRARSPECPQRRATPPPS
jgi:hypothetical protein